MMDMHEFSRLAIETVFDRVIDALQISTGSGGGMTKLTIESPGEGEKATLVGASVQDDPVSQELIEVLKSGSTTPVAP